MAGLGLVRRVGGVELAAASDRIDGGWDEVVVDAAAEKTDSARRSDVLAREVSQVRFEFDLAQRWRQLQRSIQPKLARDLVEQLIDGVHADGLEHVAL